MNDEASPAKRRTMTAKSIVKIAARINEMTDASAARKRRRKLGERLLAQIASEEVKNPVAVAKAYMKSFPKTKASAEAETDSEDAQA